MKKTTKEKTSWKIPSRSILVIFLFLSAILVLIPHETHGWFLEKVDEKYCGIKGHGYDTYHKECLQYTLEECHGCEENQSRPILGWSNIGRMPVEACPCMRATPILATGVYDCYEEVVTYSVELPDNFTWADIHGFNYKIDREAILKIVDDSNLPIVCGLEELYFRGDPTGYDCYQDRVYGTKSINKVTCCIGDYCSAWGQRRAKYN